MKMDAQKYRTMFPLIDLAVIRGVMQQHRRNVEKVLLTLYEMTPENGTIFPMIEPDVINLILGQHEGNEQKMLKTLFNMILDNESLLGKKPLIAKSEAKDLTCMRQIKGDGKPHNDIKHDNVIGKKPVIPKSEAKDPTCMGQIKRDGKPDDDNQHAASLIPSDVIDLDLRMDHNGNLYIKHDKKHKSTDPDGILHKSHDFKHVDSCGKQRQQRRSSCREESQPSRSRFSSTTSMKSTKHSSKKASYVQEKAYGKIDEVEDDIVTLCIHGGSKNVFCLLDKCNYANPGIGDPVLVNFARDTADEAFQKVLAVHKLHIAKGKVKGLGPTCGFIKVPKEEKDVYFMHDQCENGTPDVGTTVDVLYIRTKCKTHRATLVS